MRGVELELRGNGCAVLYLDNQPRRNALNVAMITALRQHLAALEEDVSCRAVIFSGRGDHFCAGRDLGELGGGQCSDEGIRADLDNLKNLIRSIYDFPKPVLALVRGCALGFGAAIVALSDIAYAAADARLGFPEVKVGMSPTLTTLALMRNVTSKRALALLFSGAIIDGAEAERIGLITRSLPAAELDTAFDALSADVAAASPQALGRCKRLVRSLEGVDFYSALELAIDAAYASIIDPHAIAGRRAFLAKRLAD